jgi:hypothetical protein
VEASATNTQDAPVEHQELTLHGNCIMLAVWRLLPSKRDAIAPCPVVTIVLPRVYFTSDRSGNELSCDPIVVSRRRSTDRMGNVWGGSVDAEIPFMLPKVAALLDKDAEHNVHVQSRKHRTYAMVKELIGCDVAPHPLMDQLPGGHWLLHAESNGWVPRTSNVQLASFCAMRAEFD